MKKYTIDDFIGYGVEGLSRLETERIEKLMNKGCPRIKINLKGLKFSLEFQQKIYIDRFFRVFKDGCLVMEVNKADAENLNYSMFGWLCVPKKKWTEFLRKVEEFENKLDDGGEVETWLDHDNEFEIFVVRK